ncbi:MAG: hypothetical protein ACLU99_12220 [Alphaproteobacteria bacterium]
MIYRKHKDPRCIKVMEDWWYMVENRLAPRSAQSVLRIVEEWGTNDLFAGFSD